MLREGRAHLVLAMHQPNLARQVAHAGDEAGEVFAVGVGGVARQGVDAGADVDALVVELDVAAARAVGLDGVAGVPRAW